MGPKFQRCHTFAARNLSKCCHITNLTFLSRCKARASISLIDRLASRLCSSKNTEALKFVHLIRSFAPWSVVKDVFTPSSVVSPDG
jgi:hypothetical protein